jgi:hypothetical protein
MSITFACGHCGKTFTLDDKFGGKKGKCKQCGSVMQIPGAVSAPDSMPGSVRREISPSRRAPTPAHKPVHAQEISPSRRSPTPTQAPSPDIFGFDDQPRPGPAAVMSLDEEDFEPVGAAPLPRASIGRSEPSKKKKAKRSKGSTDYSNVGRILGIVLAVILGLGGIGGIMKFVVPGFQSKSGLEALLKERIALTNQLAEVLSRVDDAASASAASADANTKMRAISSNLRTLKGTTALKSDIEALKNQYLVAQNQASLQVVNQITRIVQIPGAIQALNIQAAADELDREEKGIPQVQAGPNFGNGPGAPPGFNPPPPNFNPQPGLNNQPGPGGPNGFGSGRRRPPMPGSGPRSGQPGP